MIYNAGRMGDDERRRRIERALAAVRLAGATEDIVAAGALRAVRLAGDLVTLVLRFPVSADARAKTRAVEEAIDACLAAGAGRVEIVEEGPLGALPRAGGPGAGNAAMAAGPPAVPGVRRIVAIASGKGGVGKSTVAVNLACALARRGARAGLLDADVTGPSVPTMLGLAGARPSGGEEVPAVPRSPLPERTAGGKLVPAAAHGILAMSFGFLLEDDRPAIWRGPLIDKAIAEMLHGTEWGALDWLVIDLPPGTGDAQLTVARRAPLLGGIIVTTPQEVALVDVRRGLRMFRTIDVPVLGVIENMSVHRCEKCGHEEAIFDRGGGRRAAERAGVPFLGEIAIDARVRATGDAGIPIVAAHPKSEAAARFREIAENLVRAAAAVEAR